MKILLVFGGMVVIFLLIESCKDDSTSPPVQSIPLFSISVSVVDTNSNPVPHLRISCWNRLSLISGVLPTASDTLPVTLASSRIRLNMPTKAKVWMALYDMDNRIVLALYSDNTLWGPGFLDAHYVTGAYRTPWVLKCRCIVQDSLSNVLYRDSVYTLCWQPFPERSILGYTSAAGIFYNKDSLRFPHVLSIPPFVHTGSSGSDTLGLFSLSDTLVFVLTDTASHRQQFYERVVHKQQHDSLNFVWRPTTISASMSASKRQESQRFKTEFVKSTAVGSAWKLNQNYPNPYYR